MELSDANLHRDRPMPGAERRRQQWDRRQSGGDRGKPKGARKAGVPALQVLFQAVIVEDDALRPGEHALALRREAEKAVAADDERRAKLFFELADAGRKRGLGNMALGRRAREMAVSRDGDEIDQLADEHSGGSVKTMPARGAAELRRDRLHT